VSDALHVLLVRGDGVHLPVVTAIRAALPNLRWVASYDVAWGSVDVVAFQPGEDPETARAAAAAVPGAQVELLPARPSAMLSAPGGAPGGPPA
jgi:hypothetical protein